MQPRRMFNRTTRRASGAAGAAGSGVEALPDHRRATQSEPRRRSPLAPPRPLAQRRQPQPQPELQLGTAARHDGTRSASRRAARVARRAARQMEFVQAAGLMPADAASIDDVDPEMPPPPQLAKAAPVAAFPATNIDDGAALTRMDSTETVEGVRCASPIPPTPYHQVTRAPAFVCSESFAIAHLSRGICT
eukprot:SAG11_NODE_1835_length_4188_cov_2.482514_5_plen_191_part_00